MLIRFCFSFFLLMFSTAVIAVECVAVFSDGIQNNSNSGEITFKWISKVTNSPDNILDSKNAINDNSSGVSCDSTTCSSSGSIASAVTYNDFPNSSDDISVNFGQTQSISPGNYNNITLASSATLNLAEGDYTLKGSLAVGFASSINISGKVRIFVKNTIKFNSLTSINAGGTAADLLLYAGDDFNILSLSTVTAFMYSKQDVTVNFFATVNGAVSGRNVELVSASTVNFISEEPYFGDFCESSVVSPSTLILEYRMDENSWSGVADEVIDEAGNFNGQAVNAPSTANATPAISGNPGTCGYGVFDGSDDYVVLPASFENQQDSFTITAWINPSNLDAGSRILADDENNSQGYALSLGDPGSGKLRFYSRGVSPISVDTQSSIIPVDAWTFVAAVHNSVTKTRIIYVNGIAQTVVSNDGQVGLSNTYSGSWGVDTGIASIGGETDLGELANRFTGAIDEVRMYQGALTSAEIATIYTETHACASTVDHFEIAHDGQGLTCEAENITIKACADAACTALSTDAIDVQLSVNGTFNKTVTVSGGSTDTSFSYTDASTATLSLDQSYECANGGSTSCDVTFADTGFRFYADSEGTSIPTQLSGKPSNTGFNTRTLKLQAVKKDPLEGACDAALTDSVIVELSASCKNPSACIVGEEVIINNLTTDTTISTQDDGAAAVYTDVAMNFGTNVDNAAEFVFTYPEAGQMQLHARYNILDENGDPSGVYMEGSSNNFVVRPLGFYVNVANNPKAQDATGTKFIAAGEDFATSLTAVQWQSEEDDNDGSADGIPDDDADLSSHTITKNFGNESTAEAATAEIEKGLVAPSSGTLDNTDKYSFTNFVNGVATNSAMTYDEVGIISFTATAASYLDADDVIGKAPYVGRFIPDHFELTSFTVENSCGDFTYMDEPNLNFTYEITAQTKGDETTLNYISSAVAGNNFVNSTVVFVAENDNDGIDLSGRLTNYQGAWDLGVYANEDNTGLGDDLGQFTRAIDYDGPYDNLLIGVMLTDTDERVLENLDMKVTSNNDCKADDDCDAKQSYSGNSQIRFGRWQIENTFGSERSDLSFSMAVQYYDGNNFVTNTLDTCTTFDGNADANYTLTLTKRDLTALDNPLASIGLTSISGSGTFADGVAELEIGMPSDGSQGQIRLTYDATPTWLKYDWDWDGVDAKEFNQDPSAVATFGLFRGNDRIIYQREIHQ